MAETREFSENNIRTFEEITPSGWVDVVTYHPSSCPWDCYGRRHQREYCEVFRAAGINAIPLTTSQTIIHPRGSGPRGRVRFGDNMMPGIYRVAVAETDKARAELAIAEHQKAIENWLHNGAPMPSACRY